MKKISYSGYRFPPEIIHQAIWLYLRFTLSFRDVEDLLAQRGIAISYETVRRWVNHFGPPSLRKVLIICWCEGSAFQEFSLALVRYRPIIVTRLAVGEIPHWRE